MVLGDAPFRIQRTIGLIPAHGLGLGRRAVLLAIVSWVPIAVWAELAGRALPGVAAEPLLQHFGIQVRCLVAIPLLVLAEGRRIAAPFARSSVAWSAGATRRCRGF